MPDQMDRVQPSVRRSLPRCTIHPNWRVSWWTSTPWLGSLRSRDNRRWRGGSECRSISKRTTGTGGSGAVVSSGGCRIDASNQTIGHRDNQLLLERVNSWRPNVGLLRTCHQWYTIPLIRSAVPTYGGSDGWLYRTALGADKIRAILKPRFNPIAFPIYGCAAAEAQAVRPSPLPVSTEGSPQVLRSHFLDHLSGDSAPIKQARCREDNRAACVLPSKI